jgi:acyl-CoA reductase-like NAD-dependent aldehyde dehydrogenase
MGATELVTSITTINPATGKPIERFAYFSDSQVEERLSRAHAAAASWRKTPIETRAQIVCELAKRLRAQSEALAATATREMGKPIAQARAEVEKCALSCEYFANEAPQMLEPRQIYTNAAKSYVAFRPLGVILAIMPWNFPYWQVFRAAIPALMAGNTVLVKHADITTRCSLEIERIFSEAGAEPGVLSALLIDHERADALVADRRIAGVTLTGSERAGVAVAGAAGAALKKCVLELGGSDAFVVLADADLPRAVQTAVKARLQNNGQSCIAAKRFIVESQIYDEFLARFTEATRAQHVGDPMEDSTDVGPCARADLVQSLDRQVQATIERGGRLVLGGHPIRRDGFFYEPTIVDNVSPGMPMFDEETFGPAAAVLKTDDVEHAIGLANASNYGLGFAIWTNDTERAESIAARIEAGSVFINGMVASDPRLPFGGVKKSGYGRELSSFGIHEFTNIQTVSIGG